MDVSAPNVAAIVITYNRRDRLRRWLQCVQQQTLPPSAVFVVDNGGTDGTGQMVRESFSCVHYLSLNENRGPSAAAAFGMQEAFQHGFDWLWMFDDDAFPQPDALESALEISRRVGDDALGMVWLPFSDFGGWMWRGRKIPVSVTERSENGQKPFRVDQVDLNMTLISRRLIAAVGYPRSDFFIMLWSCDYCLRVAQAGFTIWVAPRVAVAHEHAGSDELGLWRSYYQTRNQLVMALERRSLRLLGEWFFRQVRFGVGTILYHDRKRERLWLRLRGAWDGVRGVMGKVVDPADYVADPSPSDLDTSAYGRKPCSRTQ